MLSEFHLISAVFIFSAAIIPIYLSFRIKSRYVWFFISLSIFAMIHGFYHFVGIWSLSLMTEEILETISVCVLVGLGVMFVNMSRAKRLESGV